mgnify:FL=1
MYIFYFYKLKLISTLKERILMANCIIAQSGGPTAVINSSVVGLVEANNTLGVFNKVYAGLNGIEGILNILI